MHVALSGYNDKFRRAGYRPTIKYRRTPEQALAHLSPELRPKQPEWAATYVPKRWSAPDWMLEGQGFRRPKKKAGRRGYATLATLSTASEQATMMPMSTFEPSVRTIEDADRLWAKEGRTWTSGPYQPGDLVYVL